MPHAALGGTSAAAQPRLCPARNEARISESWSFRDLDLLHNSRLGAASASQGSKGLWEARAMLTRAPFRMRRTGGKLGAAEAARRSPLLTIAGSCFALLRPEPPYRHIRCVIRREGTKIPLLRSRGLFPPRHTIRCVRMWVNVTVIMPSTLITRAYQSLYRPSQGTWSRHGPRGTTGGRCQAGYGRVWVGGPATRGRQRGGGGPRYRFGH